MCCLTLIERYRLRTSHYWHIPLKSQRLPRVSSPQIQSTSLMEGMQAVLGFLLPFPSCLFHTLASSSGKSTLLRLLILSLHAYIYICIQPSTFDSDPCRIRGKKMAHQHVWPGVWHLCACGPPHLEALIRPTTPSCLRACQRAWGPCP